MFISFVFGEDFEVGVFVYRGECMLGRGFKFGFKEGIEDGIQVIVEKGQGFGDRNLFVYSVFKFIFSLDDFQEDEGVDVDFNVVGQLVGEESQDEDNCGFQGFVFLVVFGVGEFGDDNVIVGQDDDVWQDKVDYYVLKLEYY